MDHTAFGNMLVIDHDRVYVDAGFQVDPAASVDMAQILSSPVIE
jgi:hypothetical protein